MQAQPSKYIVIEVPKVYSNGNEKAAQTKPEVTFTHLEFWWFARQQHVYKPGATTYGIKFYKPMIKDTFYNVSTELQIRKSLAEWMNIQVSVMRDIAVRFRSIANKYEDCLWEAREVLAKRRASPMDCVFEVIQGHQEAKGEVSFEYLHYHTALPLTELLDALAAWSQVGVVFTKEGKFYLKPSVLDHG